VNSGFFILIILVLFLVWLFLVRPQRRRQQAHEMMVEELRVGDEVLTAGGFFAIVRGISEDEVTVELSPGNEARLSKRAIAAVLPPEDALEPEAEPEPTAQAVQEPTGETRR
jgi:preprotein translocase subunit YajC